MAVAAYASLVSLTHVLHNLHYRAQFQRPRLDIQLVEKLQGSVNDLLNFVEAHSLSEREEIKALWRKMAKVALEAEDIIDSHVVNHLRRLESQEEPVYVGFPTFYQKVNKKVKFVLKQFQGNRLRRLSTFCGDLQKVLKRIEFIQTKVQAAHEEEDGVQARIQPNFSTPVAGPSAATSGSQSYMVGFDKHGDTIFDVLTSDCKANLQVLPIVGTGGIGKTTLAKYIFEHPSINHHFDIRLWITISQKFSIEQILKSLLNEQENETKGESVAELGERFYKILYGRRYLIVMEDVWTADVWDDLKMFFPNNDDGSWIMMITRVKVVGDYVGSHEPYFINFLSKDESFKLLCHKIFGQDLCLRTDLEVIGRDIAIRCRGLPLLINVIGGLLAKSNMTKEHWEFVAQNVNNLENNEDCYRSLWLSYNSLPLHLKPCFLYMRVYPEDAEIDASDLIKLWVAEGFIKIADHKSLEEIAEEYIKDLIDRNLIFMNKRTIRGDVETCGIHDLLRDLCSREFLKEHFNYLPKVQYWEKQDHANTCFLCNGRSTNEETIKVHGCVHFCSSTPETCLYLCDTCKMFQPHIKKQKLLKLMDVGSSNFMQPTGLRYARVRLMTYDPVQNVRRSKSLSSLHLLWNLQTLKIHDNMMKAGRLRLSSQIWEMPQLRHLDVYDAVLPYVNRTRGNDMILENLQTLSRIYDFQFGQDILVRIPNVKELAIGVASDVYLTGLCKLESLSIEIIVSNTHDGRDFWRMRERGEGWYPSFELPKSLKKLVLMHCPIPWENMTAIGLLPNLEELAFHGSGKGDEWNPEKGEFPQLKGLTIERCEVVHWNADSECFPMLKWLRLDSMYNFEIPLDIGCSDTLRLIELHWCGKLVIESAKRIWEEHHHYMGNENLRVSVVDIALGTEREFDASRPEGLETLDEILHKAKLIKIKL